MARAASKATKKRGTRRGGGLSLPLTGRLLGHTQARTTQRYAHLADDPLRDAAEKIASAITKAGKGGKVVPLRGGT
jgi:integrase